MPVSRFAADFRGVFSPRKNCPGKRQGGPSLRFIATTCDDVGCYTRDLRRLSAHNCDHEFSSRGVGGKVVRRTLDRQGCGMMPSPPRVFRKEGLGGTAISWTDALIENARLGATWSVLVGPPRANVRNVPRHGVFQSHRRRADGTSARQPSCGRDSLTLGELLNNTLAQKCPARLPVRRREPFLNPP